MSATFAGLGLPLQRQAARFEQRLGRKIQQVDKEVAEQTATLKGEERFVVIEAIYERHGYHPIQSVGLGASFLVSVPVLVSAIFLLTGDERLIGTSFLFIADLSQPDPLLGPVNVLPLVMFAVTAVDARSRFKDDLKSQGRFLIVAVVLLVIVYGLASALVLYWTGSNLMSLVLNRLGVR